MKRTTRSLALAASTIAMLGFGADDAMACRLGIGDRVWQDNNGNGIQDGGEPGINGVRVNISPGYYSNPLDENSLVTSVVTSDGPAGFGAGYYLFNGVDCNTAYTISIDFSSLPAGVSATSLRIGSDNAVDSDDPAGTTVTLEDRGSDYANVTIDFGFVPAARCDAAVGNFVFNDANNNGIQDPGEGGVGGAVVSLTGASTGTFTTGVSGTYAFTNLCAGTYKVCVGTPMNYQLSPADQTSDALDSDGVQEGADSCANVTLGDLEVNNDIDFGFSPKPTSNPGTGTPGYWKNHPEAWPVDEITIGGVTYSQAAALAAMSLPDGDKTVTMFRSLVSAKLNVLIGNDDSCIAATISQADSWMATYGPVGSGVKARTQAWKNGEPLYFELDAYNNGDRCAPHRN